MNFNQQLNQTLSPHPPPQSLYSQSPGGPLSNGSNMNSSIQNMNYAPNPSNNSPNPPIPNLAQMSSNNLINPPESNLQLNSNATSEGVVNQPQIVQQPQNQQLAQQQAPVQINAAALCRLGQDAVQELVSRTNEIFQCLKTTQLPEGKLGQPGSGMQPIDRKPRIHEALRTIKALFKRIRVIYEKIEEAFPSSDNMDEEISSLIPYEGGKVSLYEDRKNSESYRSGVEEHKGVVEELLLKNKQLKETINALRQIIWDVNTMLAMRKE